MDPKNATHDEEDDDVTAVTSFFERVFHPIPDHSTCVVGFLISKKTSVPVVAFLFSFLYLFIYLLNYIIKSFFGLRIAAHDQ